jgi:hypothetical protein
MANRNTRYEVLVSADSAEQAIEIASEALPKHSVLAKSEAVDASAEHGPNSWQVSLTYRQGRMAEDQSN